MATGNGYGFGAAAAILGISESRLRYWSQSGFIGPSLREGGKQVFSFQDLAAVKAAKELVDRGFSTADVRRALDHVRTILPGMDRPLEHLRVAFNGTELVLVEDGAAFALSGQRVFDFGLGELRARATGWGRTTPLPLQASGGEPNPAENGTESTDLESALGPTPTPAPRSGAPATGADKTGTKGSKTRNAYDWFQEALRLERAGKFDDAAAAYRRALKLDPGLGAAHTNLGRLAHGRGDVAEARASFDAALAVDPEQPEARYNLAHILCEAGEMELGAAELRRVVQLAPDFADAHYNLATALEALGGKRQAREHLERFLQLLPASGGTATDTTFRQDASERIARLSA
ncbi:MAG TPA: tetratricopeptide repeat protein [Polyangia bacterium]